MSLYLAGDYIFGIHDFSRLMIFFCFSCLQHGLLLCKRTSPLLFDFLQEVKRLCSPMAFTKGIRQGKHIRISVEKMWVQFLNTRNTHLLET